MVIITEYSFMPDLQQIINERGGSEYIARLVRADTAQREAITGMLDADAKDGTELLKRDETREMLEHLAEGGSYFLNAWNNHDPWRQLIVNRYAKWDTLNGYQITPEGRAWLESEGL